MLRILLNIGFGFIWLVLVLYWNILFCVLKSMLLVEGIRLLYKLEGKLDKELYNLIFEN